MKNKKIKNSGFTLVEVIVAMAILAFLMTAISSLMGVGIFNYKKSKADVRLQTTAQDTYSRLSDSIMQAKTIVIKGYTSTNPLSFKNSGSGTTETLTLKYYVANDDVRNKLVANPARYGITDASVAATDVALFSSISSSEEIYVAAIGIERASQINLGNITGVAYSGNESFLDKFLGTNVQVTGPHTVAGEEKIIANDTAVDFYVFDGDTIYYGVDYAIMDLAVDTMDRSSADSMKNHVFTKSLSYVRSGANNVTGCVAKIDEDNAAIDLKLIFNDKNMTFTSDGLVYVRNTNVMKNN